MDCGRAYDLSFIRSATGIPKCPHCGGIIKPDVVLYEEPLEQMTMVKAEIALNEADLLIVAGTSLKVYPAASFINYYHKDNIIVINKEKLDLNKKVTLEINAPIGETFKNLEDFLE